VESRGQRQHGANGDIAWQIAVGTHQPCPIRALGGGIEMHDLAGRMHTGVRTPRTDDRNRLSGHRGKGLFQRPLHGPAVPLRLPAAEAGSVVLDDTGNTHQRALWPLAAPLGGRPVPPSSMCRRALLRGCGSTPQRTLSRRLCASLRCCSLPEDATSSSALVALSGSPMSI